LSTHGDDANTQRLLFRALLETTAHERCGPFVYTVSENLEFKNHTKETL
jgi:hypothetical protein